MSWDIVTISLGYGIDPKLLEPDIQHYQNVNFPNCEEILVVNDASEDVGSGGSALNALVRTAERLCYRKKCSVLTEAVLQKANILIVLVNRKEAFLTTYGAIDGGNGYVFDNYLARAIKMATEMVELAEQKGVWIIGTDYSWSLHKHLRFYKFPQDSITGFTFLDSNDPSIKRVGIYKTREDVYNLVGMKFDGEVSGKNTPEPSPGKEYTILSLLNLPVNIASAFLSLYNEFPVAATTYLGVDSNVKPLKLSMFFDLMLATLITEEEFIASKLGIGDKISENEKDRTAARRQIYKKIGGFKGRMDVLEVKTYEARRDLHKLRDYSNLVSSIVSERSERREGVEPIEIERMYRTQMSLDKMNGVPIKETISKMISTCKEKIQKAKSPEAYLEQIFHASLALSVASEGKGGLRNGPAKNPIFEKLMQGSDKKAYLTAIFNEILGNWLSDPSMMIRAARHLETAGQKCIREMVDEMCEGKTLKMIKSDGEKYVSSKVTAPVRLDFFGGWLDTPPIFFKMWDPAVVNMAIKLDGKNPISCHITRINEPHIELHQDGAFIIIKNDQDLLHMHDKPSETGTLVCACIAALGFQTPAALFEILDCNGLRIETKSDLPHGSGLGTSSILACAILKALCALGKVEEKKVSLEYQLVYTVLQVEQIMTTGGGWQDQCGAVFGGLKKCSYIKGQGIIHSPMRIKESVKELLEKRLLLVYSGKTRLAKNLLQEVIRNFFTCNGTLKKLKDMEDSMEQFCERLQAGEIDLELLDKYNLTKTIMTRCEPYVVRTLIQSLKLEHKIEAGWCAGAGGGGFIYLWLAPEHNKATIERYFKPLPMFNTMTCHTITISTDNPLTLELC